MPVLPHIETSQLIFTANQLTGFYMGVTLACNELNATKSLVRDLKWCFWLRHKLQKDYRKLKVKKQVSSCLGRSVRSIYLVKQLWCSFSWKYLECINFCAHYILRILAFSVKFNGMFEILRNFPFAKCNPRKIFLKLSSEKFNPRQKFGKISER